MNASTGLGRRLRAGRASVRTQHSFGAVRCARSACCPARPCLVHSNLRPAIVPDKQLDRASCLSTGARSRAKAAAALPFGGWSCHGFGVGAPAVDGALVAGAGGRDRPSRGTAALPAIAHARFHRLSAGASHPLAWAIAHLALALTLLATLTAVGGCATATARNAVPLALIEQAEVRGLKATRFWGDEVGSGKLADVSARLPNMKAVAIADKRDKGRPSSTIWHCRAAGRTAPSARGCWWAGRRPGRGRASRSSPA